MLNDLTGTIEYVMDRYITGLSSLIYVHALIVWLFVTLTPLVPWHNEPLRDAKRLRNLEEDGDATKNKITILKT